MDGIEREQSTAVEGFSFYTEKDARLAELERKKIDYLEERLDYSNPEKILQIYDKAIHDRIFKTPVGIFYLRQMQNYLMEQKQITPERIAPIPLYQTFGGELRFDKNPARNRIKVSDSQEKKASALSISIVLNLLMAAAIVAMFVIALTANQPNILNYERTLTNRYASWEQELTEREQLIREKERELKLEAQ